MLHIYTIRDAQVFNVAVRSEMRVSAGNYIPFFTKIKLKTRKYLPFYAPLLLCLVYILWVWIGNAFVVPFFIFVEETYSCGKCYFARTEDSIARLETSRGAYFQPSAGRPDCFRERIELYSWSHQIAVFGVDVTAAHIQFFAISGEFHLVDNRDILLFVEQEVDICIIFKVKNIFFLRLEVEFWSDRSLYCSCRIYGICDALREDNLRKQRHRNKN